MTQPTRLICQPWASLADLDAWPNKPTLDDDTWEDLLWMASEMLYVWSGRQYTGGCRSTVSLNFRRDAACDERDVRDPYAPFVGRVRGGVRRWVVARLPDAPVTGIDTVVAPDGTEFARGVDFTADYSSGLITRTSGSWQSGTTVTYSHGLLPPIGGMRAVIALTIELGKMWTGSKCNLPKRVESISREGITIGLVSSLQGWRTGLWDIDAWLSSVNPHMAPKRATAWSPDVPYGQRITQ